MTEKHVIQGPPGTGKSYQLATVWIPKAAQKYGSEALVVCSLTRAAARVISSRVESLQIPDEQVGTLHRLLYHAYGKPTILESKHLKAWNEEAPFHWRLSSAVTARKYRLKEEDGTLKSDYPGDEIHTDVDLLRARMTPMDRWPTGHETFHQAWTVYKEEHAYTEFTDLVETALQEKMPCPGLPSVLFVDEAQDYSALEMALVDMWGETCEYYVLAGDPNQAIFTFRGANPTLMMRGATKVWPLKKSYRCPNSVVEFAEKLLARAHVKYQVDYESTGEPGVVNDYVMVDDVVDYCKSLTNGYDSAMYLASCRFLLPCKDLREYGVPYHNPYTARDDLLNPLGLRSRRGYANRLRALLSPRFPDLIGGAEQRPWTWGELYLWTKHIKAKDVLTRGAKKTIYEHADVEEESKHEISKEDYVTLFTTVDPLVAKTISWLLGWFGEHLLRSHCTGYEFALRVGQRDPTLLYEEPSLILGTIHSVKGGEADCVALSRDMSPAAYNRSIETGDWDTAIRTAYVGATRAKTRLDVLEPKTECYLLDL